MSHTIYTEQITLEVLKCGECGIQFSVPAFFIAERRTSGGTWYCPNGHGRVFRETDAEILRKKLAQIEQELTASKWETAQERSLREGTERRLSRLSKRVKNGVCPCCNRSFHNLCRHMKTQHPGWKQPAQ